MNSRTTTTVGPKAAPAEHTIAVGGLGAIGYAVARELDRNPRGLRLLAVSAANLERASARVADFRMPPKVVRAGELSCAEVVVEAAPAAAFDDIAAAAIEHGRVLVVASVGALLAREFLIDRARQSGARIVVASGALAGLDAIRALAHSDIVSILIETRKRPESLEGAPYLRHHGIHLGAIRDATRVFQGNALEAASGFPANANVAAALALAGIGPERTRVEIWADPSVTRNVHTVRVESAAARLTVCVEAVPSELNPRTSQLAPLSVIACVRGLFETLKVGS